MKSSISIIVPAFNEEGNLAALVNKTRAKVREYFYAYEFIIIDDGSTDKTYQIAESLVATDPNVRVVHHLKNMGLGYSLREGYNLAQKEFTMWTPGDHGMLSKSLDFLFEEVGNVDVVIPYIADPRFRSLKRRLVSRLYVSLFNVVFGLDLLYYNGPHVYRTNVIQKVRTTTYGFAFFAEIIVILIKGGCSYAEVPSFHQKRTSGNSKAFTFKNLTEIAKTIIELFWDIRLHKSKRYSAPSEVHTTL